MGQPTMASVSAQPGFLQDEVLRIAASLEKNSEHPLAQAILRGAEARGVNTVQPGSFRAITGKGVTGTVDGRAAAFGNLTLIDEQGIGTAHLAGDIETHQQRGNTVMVLIVEERLAGLITVTDSIKSTTPAAIEALREEGLDIVMLTGDHLTTATAVASQLGIEEVFAGVLPEDKAAKIKALQAKGHTVGMAGDGINDAPALAQADVGIAMGTGTDVAIESAGVTLVRGNLEGIVQARRLSRATMRNIRQNLFFAFVYNGVGITIATGVLYPSTGLLLSPMIAAAAMSLSSVSVIANALRLARADLQ